jgi:predicted NACHT family NTPase
LPWDRLKSERSLLIGDEDTMDFSQLWKEYKELILVIATVIVTLLGQRILPGLWKALLKLWGVIIAGLGRRLSAEKFGQRYLEWLCEEYRFLRVRGIRTRSPVAVELEKVYVSLTLNRPLRSTPGIEAEKALELEKELPEDVRSKLEPGLDIRTEKRERLAVGDVLQRCPERLIILGRPGTGKTTLLSYLGLKFARGQAKETLGLDEKRLPILIPLRELPRTGLTLTTENIPALCTTSELAKECPEGFFKKRLESGDCILLLDGMDEVTDEKERRRVAEQIEDLVTTYRENRYIVTSRPGGYGKSALTGFTQLDVCDFTDEDVEAFAHYWCLAVELAVRGLESEISEALARRKAEREADELVAAIRASDRVRNLTVNPLLLTIVAMVHRYRATLPNRRVELYEECTEVLLGSWDEAKGIAGQLDWKRKRRVLEPLAHWMHQQGLREADYTQVEKAIAQALPSVGEREAKASEFLRDVRERSGLLMERGLGIYGFSTLHFRSI